MTRPGHIPISPTEEISRVIPFIQQFARTPMYHFNRYIKGPSGQAAPPLVPI